MSHLLKRHREHVILLNPSDLKEAMKLAERKYKFSRSVGHKDRMKGSVEELILTDARAIMSEQAVAKLMGWEWVGKKNGAGQPDFTVDGLNIDVKSTIRPYPTLRIPTYGESGIGRNKMDRFILVSICRSHQHAIVLGWISKRRAMRCGKHGSRPSGCFWEVRRPFLTSMEDW